MMRRGTEHREDLAGLARRRSKLRQLRADRERGDHADEHRDAAEARRRPGVHVALADLRVEPVPRAELPDQQREPEGDDGGDAGRRGRRRLCALGRPPRCG